MAKVKLTDRYISSRKCPEGQRLEISDSVCPGLYLRISGTGAKSFCLIVRHGSLIRRTLGRYPALGLSDARKLALEALREMAPKIVRIAGERLHDEISLILTSANRGPALQMLRETGLLRVLLPELPEGRGTRLGLLRGPVSMPLAWAALLEGVSDVAGVMRRFRFSHVEAEQCLGLLRGELQFGRVNEMPVAELKRFLRMANFAEQLELHRASCEAQVVGFATYEHMHGLLAQWSAEELRPIALLIQATRRELRMRRTG